MILAIDWMQYATYFLYITLIVLLMVIGYKYLLRRFNRDRIEKEDYVDLFSFENYLASGDVNLFYEVYSAKHIRFYVTDTSGKEIVVLVDEVKKPGGYNVCFDSTKLDNGDYYYCIQTSNQKTEKIVRIRN